MGCRKFTKTKKRILYIAKKMLVVVFGVRYTPITHLGGK